MPDHWPNAESRQGSSPGAGKFRLEKRTLPKTTPSGALGKARGALTRRAKALLLIGLIRAGGGSAVRLRLGGLLLLLLLLGLRLLVSRSRSRLGGLRSLSHAGLIVSGRGRGGDRLVRRHLVSSGGGGGRRVARGLLGAAFHDRGGGGLGRRGRLLGGLLVLLRLGGRDIDGLRRGRGGCLSGGILNLPGLHFRLEGRVRGSKALLDGSFDFGHLLVGAVVNDKTEADRGDKSRREQLEYESKHLDLSLGVLAPPPAPLPSASHPVASQRRTRRLGCLSTLFIGRNYGKRSVNRRYGAFFSKKRALIFGRRAAGGAPSCWRKLLFCRRFWRFRAEHADRRHAVREGEREPFADNERARAADDPARAVARQHESAGERRLGP